MQVNTLKIPATPPCDDMKYRKLRHEEINYYESDKRVILY